MPVTVKGRKGDTVVDADEGPRRDSSIEALAKLRPAFTKDGSVTAGNSSPLNDGAAAVMVVSDGYAKAHGLTPLAKIRATAVAGVPPRVMGLGPVPAVAKVLDRAGVTLDDIGLIELNEAFAAQSLGCIPRVGAGRRRPAGERQRRARSRSGIRSAHPARACSRRSSTRWGAATT